jgi:hypothetical protein
MAAREQRVGMVSMGVGIGDDGESGQSDRADEKHCLFVVVHYQLINECLGEKKNEVALVCGVVGRSTASEKAQERKERSKGVCGRGVANKEGRCRCVGKLKHVPDRTRSVRLSPTLCNIAPRKQRGKENRNPSGLCICRRFPNFQASGVCALHCLRLHVPSPVFNNMFLHFSFF